MGCDGGTIPKRNEIVKNKQKNQERDKNADLSAKWEFCSLSGQRLKKPIVACQLGRLYNKEAIIEHLLESKSSGPSTSNLQVSHIRSLKDVRELNLKTKQDSKESHQASSGNEKFKAQFVCPISGLILNGKYRIYYIYTCGCVLSERALKEVPNEKQCILCSKSYNPQTDLIPLNSDDIKELEERRLLRQRSQRKNIKRSSNSDCSSQPSTSLVGVICRITSESSSSKRRKYNADTVR